MPTPTNPRDLVIDLLGGVVPISSAASALAGLFKRARERRQPIVITQKGYPTAVILPIELFAALRELAERSNGVIPAPPSSHADASAPTDATPVADAPAPTAPSRPRSRGGHRANASQGEAP